LFCEAFNCAAHESAARGRSADRLLSLIFPPQQERKTSMKILYINGDGGGWAGITEIPDGQTVQELFAARVPYGKPENYLIRVNRQPVDPAHVLVEGDRVSFTPTKIEGAATA